MATPCPKCGSAVGSGDGPAPAECPSCGVVFAKLAASSNRPPVQAVPVDPTARRPLLVEVVPRRVHAFNWNLLPGVLAALAALAVAITYLRAGVSGSVVQKSVAAATDINSSATSGVALTVTQLACAAAGDTMAVRGEVQNRSQQTLALTVDLGFRDRDGATLHRSVALDRQPLDSLETSTFAATFPLLPQFAAECRILSFTDADGRGVAWNLAGGVTADTGDEAH